MGVLVQIRDVPEDVHRTLKARAARRGTSLSEYLRTELQRVAETMTPEELLAHLRSLPPAQIGRTSAADVIREQREERERDLVDRVGR